DILRSQWSALRREENETCRKFVTRTARMRRNLSCAGIYLSNEDELIALRNGLYEPYSEWVATYMTQLQFMVSLTQLSGSTILGDGLQDQLIDDRQMVSLRTSLCFRGDEWETRHGRIAPAVGPNGGVPNPKEKPADKRSSQGQQRGRPATAHVLCRQFARGHCTYGDRCRFKHGSVTEGNEQKPASNPSGQGHSGSSKVGYPSLIVSDSHSSFSGSNNQLNDRYRKWAATHDVRVACLPPNVKVYCGRFERPHARVREMLMFFESQGYDVKRWPRWLPSISLSYNLCPFIGCDFSRADLFYGHRINKPWTTLSPDEVEGFLTGVSQLLNDYETESLKTLFKQERADAKLRYDKYCEYWQMSRDLQQSALSKKLAGKKSDPQPYLATLAAEPLDVQRKIRRY
ncbi:hypothetical protein FOZ63_008282, partial [Perkinsus olseni]